MRQSQAVVCVPTNAAAVEELSYNPSGSKVSNVQPSNACRLRFLAYMPSAAAATAKPRGGLDVICAAMRLLTLSAPPALSCHLEQHQETGNLWLSVQVKNMVGQEANSRHRTQYFECFCSQGLTALPNHPGTEPCTPVGKKLAGCSPLHFMMSPVHKVDVAQQQVPGRPELQDPQGGLAPNS